jgi:hypothetical protein
MRYLDKKHVKHVAISMKEEAAQGKRSNFGALFPQHDGMVGVMIVLEIFCSNNRKLPALAGTSPETVHTHSSINRLFGHAAIRRPFSAQNTDESTVGIRNDHVIARKRLGVAGRSARVADQRTKARPRSKHFVSLDLVQVVTKMWCGNAVCAYTCRCKNLLLSASIQFTSARVGVGRSCKAAVRSVVPITTLP